jgi:hypothetical protein
LTTPPEPRTAGAAFALVGPPEDLKSAIEADDVRGTFDMFHSGDGIVDPGRIPDVRDGVELGEDLHVRRVRARKVDGKRGLCAPSTCHWRHRHATDKAEQEDERQISAPAVGEGGPEPVPGDQVSSPPHGAVPSSNGSLTSWSTHRDRLVLSPPQRGIRVTWSQGSYPVRPSRASTTMSTDRMTPASALLATPVEHGFGFTRNVGHVAFPSTAARQRRDQADQSKMFPAVAAHDAVLSLESSTSTAPPPNPARLRPGCPLSDNSCCSHLVSFVSIGASADQQRSPLRPAPDSKTEGPGSPSQTPVHAAPSGTIELLVPYSS